MPLNHSQGVDEVCKCHHFKELPTKVSEKERLTCAQIHLVQMREVLQRPKKKT